MKKLIIYTLAHLFIITSVIAQNNIWSLPPNYFDFINPIQAFQTQTGSNTLGVPNYSGQSASYCHNAMQDASGNLLFFIIDEVVYDANGNTYFYSELKKGLNIYKGNSEILIVPDPGDCNRYYIFTTQPTVEFGNESNPELIPGYAILNLSLEYDPINYPGLLTGLEEFAPLNNNQFISDLPNMPNTTFEGSLHYAVTELNTLNERFLFVESEGKIYRYKISASGLTYDGQIGASLITSTSSGVTRGEMELIQTSTGYRLALTSAYLNPNNSNLYSNAVAIFELNNQGIEVGAPEVLFYDVAGQVNQLANNFSSRVSLKGLEFSPDGNYLYINRTKTAQFPATLEYYQIGSTIQPPNIPTINTVGSVHEDFRFSQIELGSDGKLYFANSTQLATFSNPNTPSFGSWTNLAQSLLPSGYNLVGSNTFGIENRLSYPLPDQIDGMNYTDHFTANLECCIDNSPYNVSVDDNTNEYYGTQTWADGSNNISGTNANLTSPIFIKDKLIIKSGANITINNMRFEFAPDAQLIIEDDARLTINGCTLTVDTRCDAAVMWHGVEVWGNGANQPFTSGRLIAQNNSTIEHAMVATANFQHQQNTNNKPIINTTVAGFNGGIINARNTTFRNNYIDTQFEEFFSTYNNDQSRFTECHFVTDAHLNNPTLNPLAHAELNKVRELRFLACVFEATATGIAAYPNIANRGFGIRAYETLFTVQDRCPSIVAFPNPCPNPIISEFNDLFVGILANGGTMRSQTAKVVNSSFNNNYGGMYFQNLDLAQATNNTIFVGNNLNPIQSAFGLYLNYCDKYKVEDNAFSTATGYYGAYINNSGTGANEIYRNTFDNFTVATQAANINGDGFSAGNGLQFKCNKYTNTTDYDVLISSGLIKAFHGKCGTIQNPNDPTTPSNNEFSYTAQFGDFWMTNNTTPPGFNVSYQMAQDPNGFQTIPKDYPINATHYNQINTNPSYCTGITYDPSNSCPQRVGKTVVVLNQLIAANTATIDNLQSQIDGGNTPHLINIINTEPAWKVRNELMAASPTLSDEVLLALLSSNMPDWVHQAVLNANTPLSDNVFLAALNKTNALPENIIRDVAIASSPLHTNEQLALIQHSPKYADWLLKEVLLADSPLKDEVLIALMDKTPVVANWAVKEVLLKNTPLSTNVTNALTNHTPSYPIWMINQINNSSFIADNAIDEPQPSSATSEINAEISYYEAETERYISDILRFYLFDEDGTDAGVSDVISYLEVENCSKTSSKCLLTGAYLANEQYANAQAVVDTLSNDSANANFCMLYNSVIQYQQTANNEYTLLTNSSLLTPVQTVASANSANNEVGIANTVLDLINNQPFEPIFEYVTPSNNNQRLAPIDELKSNTTSKVSIYPNPTKTQFTLTHNFTLEQGNITLTIYDLMGRSLLSELITDKKQVINTSSLKSGVYFYHITQNDKQLNSGKLIIE